MLEAVEAAETKAPESGKAPGVVQAAILSDMIERAALQYQLAEAGRKSAYVDGYGFARVAQSRARKALPAIKQSNAPAAEAIRSALGTLKTAYPDVNPPESMKVKAGELLALSSGVRLAIGA